MNEQKHEVKFYDKYSIGERYGVGIAKAGEIIRAIKATIGDDCFPVKGKVLPSELEYWEKKYHHFTPVAEKEEKPVSFTFDMKTAQYVADDILRAFRQEERNCGALGTITGQDLSDALKPVYEYFGRKYGARGGDLNV